MDKHSDVRELTGFIGEVLTNTGKPEININDLVTRLSILINELIDSDFQKLLNLLYQLDVPEQKVINVLRENTDANAGKLIAGLIIERQLAKIKTRQEFRRDNNFDEEEKW